jgi:hypothetical protein
MRNSRTANLSFVNKRTPALGRQQTEAKSHKDTCFTQKTGCITVQQYSLMIKIVSAAMLFSTYLPHCMVSYPTISHHCENLKPIQILHHMNADKLQQAKERDKEAY